MLYNLLKRISFGPTPKSLEHLEAIGWEAYIKEQLHPTSKDNERYYTQKEAFKFSNEVAELRGKGFQYLDAPLEELWALTKNDKTFERKGLIPAREVMVNTYLKATYSDWQLKEVLVHFWHNHFNVSIEADDQIALFLPLYDKMIRKHALGNFRTFLETVATSQAMLIYLDNAYSRASPANENYARELFELHTLGEDNYLNHLYNKWREVPGAKEGKASGYIDEDVYEAARAFTGWTIANGDEIEGTIIPNTGEFFYLEKWHDNYQKRILGVEFDSNQAPMADGQKVLDLLAKHKGTARFICTKLCRRFIADEPPQSIIDKTVATWTKQLNSPDQIKQVLFTILLSEEFQASANKKVKQPFELVISMFRALNVNIRPNMHLHWMMSSMGYRLFSWPTPTGHPDKASYWLNSNMLLKRWNIMPSILFDDWHKVLTFKPQDYIDTTTNSSKTIVDFWTTTILGNADALETAHKKPLIDILLSEDRTADDPPLTYGEEDLHYRLAHIIALMLMTPQFQYR